VKNDNFCATDPKTGNSGFPVSMPLFVSSSAFGFLLQASSHAKPLRGGLMHPSRYAVSRTLQQVQSPELNCCRCFHVLGLLFIRFK